MKHIVPLVLLLFTLTQNALATERTVRLDLPTMNCAMCPLTVKKALTRLQGVSRVDVSYEKKRSVGDF
jgi:mercuric ion binding protein